MKLRIFTVSFWRSLFVPKKSTPIISEERSNPQYESQVLLPALAKEPQEKKFPKRKPAGGTIEEEEKLIGIQAGGKAEKSTVRGELNLEQNAVFTVSTYRKKSREVIIKGTNPTGEVYERRVIIGKTVDGFETGVITTSHFKLYLTLLELWEKAGKPINEPVHFTILRIIRRLGMIDAGSNYQIIKRHLLNLRQIPLTFIDSFFISNEESFSSLKPFTILSYLDVYERKYETRKSTETTRGYGEFRFDDHILESLVNNYSHPLRLDVITGFRKHRDLAILLYSYIDRNLALKDKYEVGLEKLFDHLDLSQKQIRYPAARKQKIEPVLNELRGKELSTGVLSYAQIHKTADGNDYKLVCRKKPFVRRLREQEAPYQPELALPFGTAKSESPEAKSSSELFPLLIAKGLTHKQVAKLVAEKSPEVIEKQLEYLPFRVREYDSQRKEINEAAILYDSINDNWNVPKGYLEAEKEKEREARKLETERIALLEQEERDREEQERARIEAYKESLSTAERAGLREKALEEIRSMKGVKEEFITEILIVAKENEILRLEMEKDGDF